MTISANVRKELFEMTAADGKLIRIKPTEAKAGTTVYSSKQSQPLKMWTQEEHERFLEAMEKYPSGPWKVIAAFIGTKTTRQTMTHAQKYRQKISRWRRGLRHKGRKQHPDEHGDGEGEYDANDNLFRAIEFVAADQRGGSAAARAEGGSQLFRLAELASIEVMKGNDQPSLADENDAAMANAVGQSNRVASEWQGAASSWGPSNGDAREMKSREHGFTGDSYNARGECSHLEQGQDYVVGSPDEEEARTTGGSFQLPPLKMSPPRAAVPDLSAIPPLRSKIDPSVLRAQFASTI